MERPFAQPPNSSFKPPSSAQTSRSNRKTGWSVWHGLFWVIIDLVTLIIRAHYLQRQTKSRLRCSIWWTRASLIKCLKLSFLWEEWNFSPTSRSSWFTTGSRRRTRAERLRLVILFKFYNINSRRSSISGGIDSTNCKSDINWIPLTSQTYWQFKLSG